MTVAIEMLRSECPKSSSSTSLQSASPASILTPSRPSSTPWQCSFSGCHKSFSKPSKLLQHQRIHTGEKPFACRNAGCGASFSRKDHLDRHAQTHLDDENVLGSGCGSRAPTDTPKRSRPFQCDYKIGSVECGKRFLTSQHLRRHREETHDDARAIGFSTTEDEKARESRDENDPLLPLSSSKETEYAKSQVKRKRGGKRGRAGGEGAYKCDVLECGLAFTKRKHLRAHISESHTISVSVPLSSTGSMDQKEKKGGYCATTTSMFPCTHPGCLKQFSTHSKRAAHLQTAHDASRYMCTLPHELTDGGLDKGIIFFSTWSELQRHQRDVHPPRCHWPGCEDKVFKTRDNLRAHLRRHEEKQKLYEEDIGNPIQNSVDATDAPPPWRSATSLQCPACDRGFTSRYSRDVHHNTVHLGQRDYACTNYGCDKRYGHKHLVVRHARVCPFRDYTNRDGAQAGVEGAASSKSNDLEHEADDEAEEDEGDDFFRKEGGAVPEGSASRGRVRTRKREHKADRDSSFLVDLLTGRGYRSEVGARAGIETENSADGSCCSQKRQKLAKRRILACPWPKLKMAMTEQGQANRNFGGEGIEAVLGCDYHFSRVYDVQRHLLSKHGVELSQLKIRALLTNQERDALPLPRSRSRYSRHRLAGCQGIKDSVHGSLSISKTGSDSDTDIDADTNTHFITRRSGR